MHSYDYLLDMRLLLDNTKLSIYVADKDLIIRHCSQELASFFGINRSEIINHPIIDLVKHALKYIPEDRKKAFYDYELTMKETASTGQLPHPNTEIIISTLGHTNILEHYRGVYIVRIMTDALYSDGTHVGHFGLIVPRKITERDFDSL